MKSLNPSVFKIPLWVSLLVTNYLFYLDEGYCDFRWMKDPGNWFVFVIYVAAIYAALLAITLFSIQLTKMAKRLTS